MRLNCWGSSSIFLLDLALDSNVQNDAIQTGRRCWAGLRTIEWRLFVCHFDLTAATHIYPYIWQYHNTTNIRGKHQKLPLFAASILKFGVCCTSCWECARLKSEIKAKPIAFHGPRSEDTLSLRIHRDFLSIAFLWTELLHRVEIKTKSTPFQINHACTVSEKYVRILPFIYQIVCTTNFL